MISNNDVEKIQLITVGDFRYIGILKEENNKSTICKRFEISEECTKEELKEYVLAEYEGTLSEDLNLTGLTQIATCGLNKRQKFNLDSIVREVKFELSGADKTLKAGLIRSIIK